MPRALKRVGHVTLVLFLFASLCDVAWAQPAASRVAVFKSTTSLRSEARVEAMLSDIFGPPATVDFGDDWSSYSLLVFVQSPIPSGRNGGLTFTQKLGTYYFRGGHVLVVGIPGGTSSPPSDADTWNKLMRYFWGAKLTAATDPLTDADHRAWFVPGVEHLGTVPQFRQTVEQLLAAPDELPAQLPAENFGAATNVSLRGNSLWINGKPQLLKSVGYYDLLSTTSMASHESALRRFHTLGFNAAVLLVEYDVGGDKLREFLELARRNQIYIQLQLDSPLEANEPVRKEYLLKVLRFRDHPALIGWAMCDDMLDAHFPFIERAVSIIRRYDQRLPITSTFMDVRHPEKVKDWEKWTHLVDYPMEYVYPMQKDPHTNGVRFDIEGGFKDIDRLMANTRKVWPNAFSEQFLQAHMQSPYARQIGLSAWTEHLVPAADQERLMASRALLSGIKGMVFFYPPSLQDQGMGRGRANEIAIFWRELEPVEDILAAGKQPESLSTSDRTVDASLIRSSNENEAVIVATKDQPHYNRYVDAAQVQGLIVHLPADLSGCPIFQLGWPQPEELEVSNANGSRVVTLHPFALSTLLLLSCDQDRQRRLQEMTKNNLPDVARYAIEVLGDEHVKTAVVSDHLPAELQGDSNLLHQTATALVEANKAVATKDWATAWKKARTGMASMEEYRAQAIKAATEDADRRGASTEARVYLNLYFSLPNYAYVTRGGSTVEPDQLRREILNAQGLAVSASVDPAEANR